MKEILSYEFMGNPVSDYFMAVLFMVIGIIVVMALKRFIINRVQVRLPAQISSDKRLNAIKDWIFYLIYYGIVCLSLQKLNLNPTAESVLKTVGLVLATLLAIKLLTTLINVMVSHYCFKSEGSQSKEKCIGSLNPIIKVVVWALALFFLLDNLGFKVSTLIAGLGIGGVAVALAGQAVLGDLFSYFAIIFDKPFEIGDFIINGDSSGVVEHIGIKTTRIRSLSGEEIIVSNTALTGSRIQNYKRMQQRRVVFNIGVTYQTDIARLRQIPVMVKDIIGSIALARLDRCHFGAFRDFSLNIETVYYVTDRDYNVYMDIQQEINLKIKEAFEKAGIDFAYPTSTVQLQKMGVS